MDINGLSHWVTIGLFVKVSGPGHKQRRLLWGKPCCGLWGQTRRHRENSVPKKFCSCVTKLELRK